MTPPVDRCRTLPNPTCVHYEQANKLCTHTNQYIHNNYISKSICGIYKVNQYVQIAHSDYDGTCEWKDTCSLKIIGLNDNYTVLVENGNGEQFVIATNAIGSISADVIITNGEAKIQTAWDQ